MCESYQDKHGLPVLLLDCAWFASYCIKAELSIRIPVMCKSYQDKPGLHVLFLDSAWCASYYIRAELGMHRPVMCESYQDKPGLHVLLPDCAWCASCCCSKAGFRLTIWRGGTPCSEMLHPSGIMINV